MKIAKKITIYLSILCACSVIISGAYIAWKSADISEDAIYDRAIEQLISIREIKKSEIKNHFNTTATLLSTLAYDPSIQNAIRDFEQAYASYPADKISLQNKQQLQQFYQTQFEPKYKDKNKIASVAELYPQLSPTAAGLQARYIANNYYPMGEKHLLDSDTLNNDYDKAHASYHPVLRHYLESFGFYDIFLIDNKGDIVYSVFKEVDFATNLKQGPFKTSGIASAYNTAKTLNAGEVTLTDFSPYTPSFEQPASFLATPIFSGDEQLGVLVIQLPIDAINNIMTFDGRWDTAGLGNSGETYLVGMDLTLRSQSRFFLENKDEYIKTLKVT